VAEIPFIGPSYNLDSRPSGAQRTINLIPVPQEPGNERTAWVFEDVPGLEAWSVPDSCVPYLLDNFNGTAATDLEAHTPDTAPSGFVWRDQGGGPVELDGSGLAVPTTAPAPITTWG